MNNQVMESFVFSRIKTDLTVETGLTKASPQATKNLVQNVQVRQKNPPPIPLIRLYLLKSPLKAHSVLLARGVSIPVTRRALDFPTAENKSSLR